MNKQSFYDTIKNDPSWQSILPFFNSVTVHVAIMVEPFLSMVLEGSKTIESRFSKHRIAPYQKVKPGDIVLLKKSSGPVVASFKVAKAQYFELTPSKLKAIAQTYSKAIGADDAFWKSQTTKRYASLFAIKELRIHNPTPLHKKDPRGWVVLH